MVDGRPFLFYPTAPEPVRVIGPWIATSPRELASTPDVGAELASARVGVAAGRPGPVDEESVVPNPRPRGGKLLPYIRNLGRRQAPPPRLGTPGRGDLDLPLESHSAEVEHAPTNFFGFSGNGAFIMKRVG